MGIQQTAAPLPQTRGLKRSDEVFELAGSRAPPRAPERQRGLWSFLTWSFVIAPIVTAESFFAKNGHALTPADDQSDASAYHDKDQLAATPDHDPTVAAAAIASDGTQEDNTDASRLVGAVQRAVHNGDPEHDKSPTLAVARDTDPASAPAGGGGGGGGGPSDTNATSDGTSTLQNVDILDEGTPSGSSELTLSSAEIPDVSRNLTSSGGIPDDLSQSSGGGPYIESPAGGEPISVQIGSPSLVQIGLLGQGLLSGEIPNSLPHEIAVGASTGGGPIDTLVGNDLGLAHTTSDVISIIAKGAPDILSPIGLDTVASLKDVLGFDLHVNAAGGFVANDLSAALDGIPSQLMADVVSNAAIPGAEGLPMVGVGASEEVDSLLSGKGLLDVGHLNDVTSETSSVVAAAASAVSPESSLSTNLLDSEASKSADGLLGGKDLLDVGHLSDPISEPSSVVATSGLSSDLGSKASATLEKVSAPALSISHESGSNTNLLSTVSDAAHVGIVGEATDLTPGHSVDFPAQPASEGDVLFSGTSYTDYHVALNTGVSSSAVNGITATTTTVMNTHDVASLSPVDTPNASHASEPPAPEHHDASLIQVSNAIDELSVRGHSH